MRGFYTNQQDAIAAEDVTMADVADMPRATGGTSTVILPLTEDPFLNPDAPEDPAPF
jgi:hypothetical protein